MSPTKKNNRLTPMDWMKGAVELLAAGGIDNVKVEPLAKRLGVTKGSFYWHFTNRDALLEGVLSYWETAGTQQLIDEVTAAQATPREALRLLWRLSTVETLDPEFAIREWGRVDSVVGHRIAVVDERRLSFVTQLFGRSGLSLEDAQARAFQFYALLIGAYFIQLPGPRRQDIIDAAMEGLLPDPAS